MLVAGGGQGLGLAENLLGGAQGDAGLEQQGRARVAGRVQAHRGQSLLGQGHSPGPVVGARVHRQA